MTYKLCSMYNQELDSPGSLEVVSMTWSWELRPAGSLLLLSNRRHLMGLRMMMWSKVGLSRGWCTWGVLIQVEVHARQLQNECPSVSWVIHEGTECEQSILEEMHIQKTRVSFCYLHHLCWVRKVHQALGIFWPRRKCLLLAMQICKVSKELHQNYWVKSKKDCVRITHT
jgi:hypothetical protein